MSMGFYTPLRYPGGKRKLFPFVKEILSKNNLTDCHYVEPYAGGAGLALSLLFQKNVSHIHINDLNLSIYSFWHAVLNQTEKLCQKIENTPVTIEEWYRQKEIQTHAKKFAGTLELAFSTFFLNRTNRSGILKGGVIGGKAQAGKWKLDARFTKPNLIQRIQLIASRKENIHLYNSDALDFLGRIQEELYGKKVFLYLDPPYYKKGAGLYDNFYGHEDHYEVAQYMQLVPFPWMVSYDNTPETQKLYTENEKINYSLSYTAQRKGDGKEFMALSKTLQLPDAMEKNVFCGKMRNIKVQQNNESRL